jgi:hypothetical protein
MPMITCPDCSSEMSDTAPTCPKCGRPNSAAAVAPTKSVGILLGIGIVLFPMIFSFLTLRTGHSTKARALSFTWLAFALVVAAAQNGANQNGSTVSASKPNAVAESAMQVDIRELLAAYEGNEVGADNTYKGNLVRVTGIIGDIKKDILDNLYVTLGTGAVFEIPQVQAFFDDSQNSQLAELRKGGRLTVECRIDGLMMNVLARDCLIK